MAILGYGVARPWSRGPRVAMELVSGQPSWPLAFPPLLPDASAKCSLVGLPVIPHRDHQVRRAQSLHSGVRLSGREICRDQSLGFLSSLNPCMLTLIFLRLCLCKKLGHSTISAISDETQDLQNSDPSLACHIPLSFPPQGHCHILLPMLFLICFFFFLSQLGAKSPGTVSINKRKTAVPCFPP